MKITCLTKKIKKNNSEGDFGLKLTLNHLSSSSIDKSRKMVTAEIWEEEKKLIKF